MPTAPKKKRAGQWFPPGSFFVAIFVAGGLKSASNSPEFADIFHVSNMYEYGTHHHITILYLSFIRPDCPCSGQLFPARRV